MKYVIITIIIVAVISVLIYLYLQPRVKLGKIDWINKTVEYTMTINGEKRSGIQSLQDSVITDIKTKDGKNSFWIKSLYNAGVIEIGILENGKVKTGQLININTKSVSPLVRITTNDFGNQY